MGRHNADTAEIRDGSDARRTAQDESGESLMSDSDEVIAGECAGKTISAVEVPEFAQRVILLFTDGTSVTIASSEANVDRLRALR